MKSLIKKLIRCETLLRTVNEVFWADKISHILKMADGTLNINLIKEIISWHGGMGSFNDLIISEYNGHLIDSKNEEKLNNDLNNIRNEIYQLSVNLKDSVI